VGEVGSSGTCVRSRGGKKKRGEVDMGERWEREEGDDEMYLVAFVWIVVL